MLDAERRRSPPPGSTAQVRRFSPPSKAGRKSLETVLAFNGLIAALKARRFAESASLIFHCPRLLPLLREPLQAGLSRLRAKLFPLAAAGSYPLRKTVQ